MDSIENQYDGEKLNILLVKHSGRTACLLDISDKKLIDKLVSYAKSLKLHIRNVDNNFHLITRQKVTGEIDERRLGQLLDFLCYGHSDYGNDHLDRYAIFIGIGGYNIQTESCVASKVSMKQIDAHVETVKRRWRDTLKRLKLDLEVSSHINFDRGVVTRLKYLKERDIERIFEIKDEYVNDLLNYHDGLFVLMLKGCDYPQEITRFLDKFALFYDYAVVQDRLSSPDYNDPEMIAATERNLAIEREFISWSEEPIARVFMRRDDE